MAAAEEKTPVTPIVREDGLAALREDALWDVVIVGGGATGAGIAVDAASRGLKTLLLEGQDFSAGTSSRSTKLIHGGVRYMKNLRDWGLVHGALQERRRLIDNCPQLVHAEPFVLPCYRKWERETYTVGLGIYGAMAGKAQIGRTRTLKPAEAAARLPGVKTDGLTGGVEFFDAQFDDARLNVALMRTAAHHGAVCLNYMPVTGVERTGGLIQAVTAEDAETGESFRIRCRMVFNCAGVWADEVRRMVDPDAVKLLRFSRGTHVVVDRSFLSGDAGMLIPKTRDGRVLFAIPWHTGVLLGTTDVEVREAARDPQPTEEEIAFILETASGYLARPVGRGDVLAAFAGLRPLLSAPAGQESTAKASREHAVIPEFGNMITIAGGKWTSYRRMAEDAMFEATRRHLVPPRLCVTKDLPILVDDRFNPEEIEAAACAGEDADARVVEYALYARECEGARTARDVLWRRLRVGALNEARAEALVPKVEAAFEGRVWEAPEAAPEAAEAVEVAEAVEAAEVVEAAETVEAVEAVEAVEIAEPEVKAEVPVEAPAEAPAEVAPEAAPEEEPEDKSEEKPEAPVAAPEAEAEVVTAKAEAAEGGAAR